MIVLLMLLVMLQSQNVVGTTHEDRIRALETGQQLNSIKIVQIEDRISRNDARIDDLVRLDTDHRLTQVETEFRIMQSLLGAIGLVVLGQVVYLLSNGWRRRNGGKGP